jgi:hypothetical protein
MTITLRSHKITATMTRAFKTFLAVGGRGIRRFIIKRITPVTIKTTMMEVSSIT